MKPPSNSYTSHSEELHGRMARVLQGFWITVDEVSDQIEDPRALALPTAFVTGAAYMLLEGISDVTLQGKPSDFKSYVAANDEIKALWEELKKVKNHAQGDLKKRFDAVVQCEGDSIAAKEQLAGARNAVANLKIDLGIIIKKFETTYPENAMNSAKSHEGKENEEKEKAGQSVSMTGSGGISVGANLIQVSSGGSVRIHHGAGKDNAQIELLEKFQKEVNKVVASLEDAELITRIRRAAEVLEQEANSKKPEKKWYELSLAGLLEAGEALGELAGPMILLARKIVDLLKNQA
jgi:hypothetical protein